MAMHALTSMAFWLALAGVATSYFFYMVKPIIPATIKKNFNLIYMLLENKYYLDKFNDVVFAGGARLIGKGLWNIGDKNLIDGAIVNGSAKLIDWSSRLLRKIQTGYIYHYAFIMILGVLGFLIYLMPSPFTK